MSITTVADLRVAPLVYADAKLTTQTKTNFSDLIDRLESAAKATKNDKVSNNLFGVASLLESQIGSFAPKILPGDMALIKLFTSEVSI